jgi:hypothetical protein
MRKPGFFIATFLYQFSQTLTAMKISFFQCRMLPLLFILLFCTSGLHAQNCSSAIEIGNETSLPRVSSIVNSNDLQPIFTANPDVNRVVSVKGKFIIDENVCFDKIMFLIDEDASIVLKEFVELSITDCWLLGCNGYWRGIYLPETATLKMNGCEVDGMFDGIVRIGKN